MPQIFTASWSAALPAGAIGVGISRSTPRGLTGYRRLRVLEPGSWFRTASPVKYLELYRNILAHLDPFEICDQLASLGSISVMLCWESALDCHTGKAWCHRHLVAQWLEDRVSIKVPEFGHPDLDRFALLRGVGIRAPDFYACHTQSTVNP